MSTTISTWRSGQVDAPSMGCDAVTFLLRFMTF